MYSIQMNSNENKKALKVICNEGLDEKKKGALTSAFFIIQEN